MLPKLLPAIIFSVVTTGFINIASANDTPLVTIRFNSSVVEYEAPLSRAVTIAKKTKPDVFFDIVAVAPETQNNDHNQKFDDDLRFYTAKIHDQLTQQGVAPEMIRTTYQHNKFMKNNEIKIFVQ